VEEIGDGPLAAGPGEEGGGDLIPVEEVTEHRHEPPPVPEVEELSEGGEGLLPCPVTLELGDPVGVPPHQGGREGLFHHLGGEG